MLMHSIRNKISNYIFFTNRAFWPLMNQFNKDFIEEASFKEKNDVTLKIANVTNDFLTDIFKIIVIVMCAILVKNEYLSIFSFLIGYQMSKYLMELFSVIVEEKNLIKNYSGSLNELRTYFDLSELPNIKIGKVERIEFKNAEVKRSNFCLNINFKLSLENKYLLIGENGSGKSTFINVLSSLLPISKGQITVDEKSFTDFDCNALCFVCASSPIIFAGSFDDNVFLGKSIDIDSLGLTKPLLKIASELSSCENCANLSGGEKQFISFLRSLCVETQIIVYDEAFSQIDDEIRKAIYKFLECKNKCVIVVDHKLKNEMKFKEIIFKDGETIYG